jgi:hypothetical protein
MTWQTASETTQLEKTTARSERLTSSSIVWILLFTVIYLIPTILLAKHKLFWDDEFFTFYLSRIPTWHELITALKTGADQHPPSFYYLTHMSMLAFGASAFTMRLPEIVGFWLLCVCLFAIVRPKATLLWAVFAMLFPLTTKVYYYASEARGYGLVLGFSALAVLSWFRVTEYQKRSFFLPLLGLSLAAAVGSHYYAITVFLCLMAGEIVRTWIRRAADIPVLAALAFTFVPLVAFASTIRSARGYSSHFWAVPHWPEAFIFYKTQLGSGLIGILGMVAVLFFWQGRSAASTENPELATRKVFPVWQAAALTCLCLIPSLVMIAAKFITHAFVDRYAIATLVGMTVLITYVLSSVVLQRRLVIGALVASLMMYAYQVRTLWAGFDESLLVLDGAYGALTSSGERPVAVMNYTIYHQLSFYAPRELASRVVYISDPHASVQYLEQDTMDRGLLDLRPWFPLWVETPKSFLKENPSFLAYGMSDSWSWLLFKLPDWGETKLVRRTGNLLLFSVDTNGVATTDTYPAPKAQELWRTLSKHGSSVCDLYMKAQTCPQLQKVDLVVPH